MSEPEIRVNLRVTDEQRKRWKLAAKTARRTLADWARLTLDDQAESELAKGKDTQ
jgi:uncharacterized protein (DUF1778 family)